ncbi:hypothetical protein RB195_016702 [Necator americanus]|uniref:Mos1 transposase HTH domain-containing protein n=1 Tax=Necator americanus TaxID=51031 RepID=A0ABR1C488_NECAM
MFLLLLLQTACPAILMQAPVCLMYVMLFTDTSSTATETIVIGILLALFPVFDPIIIIASEMDIPGGKKQHFRHLLYFAFRRGQKATEAARDICAVHGEDAITARTARNWFAKFKNGNFDLDDSLRSG